MAEFVGLANSFLHNSQMIEATNIFNTQESRKKYEKIIIYGGQSLVTLIYYLNHYRVLL